MRHVGDGHDQAVAVAVAFREHGVVEVARVLAVDGDQRDGAQVFACAGRGRLGRVGIGQRLGAELGQDGVGVDADQADRAGVAHASQPLHHAGGFQAVAAAWLRRAQQDLAVLRAVAVAGCDGPLGLLAAVGRHQAIGRAEHAEDAARRVRQPLQRAPLVFAIRQEAQPGEHALTRGQGGLAFRLRRHQHHRRRAVAVPLDGAPHGVAIRVRSRDADDGGVGQAARRGKAAVPGRRDHALARHVLKDALQRHPVLRPEAELALHLALADPPAGPADEGADFLAGGQGGETAQFALARHVRERQSPWQRPSLRLGV